MQIKIMPQRRTQKTKKQKIKRRYLVTKQWEEIQQKMKELWFKQEVCLMIVWVFEGFYYKIDG
jgi:hypothetical protein